jgi:hypothetical protein
MAAPSQGETMTAAIVAQIPRFGYSFLFVAFFVAAYPLWHADFPTASINHVDDVPAAQAATPASERLGSCGGG